MNREYENSVERATSKKRWGRDKIAAKILDFERAKQAQSERQWANDQGIPRTTFQHWISRKHTIDAAPGVIEFFESPDGAEFLHNLILAAHLEFTKHGVASIHNVSNFLELCGLSRFVASSYGTQRRISIKMDEELIVYEQEERKRLSQQMRAKKITLIEDETFHPEICLVAMEPVSNYIVIEQYVENREARTWNDAVEQALQDLPVEVIQVTSDEGAGLINHALKGLQVHHSSDCFHVSYEISKGTSGALASEVRRSESQLRIATERTQKQVRRKQDYETVCPRLHKRRPGFEQAIDIAVREEQQAEAHLRQAQQNQETVRIAKAEIGKVYHPYDPETGIGQDAQKVSALLESCFDKINEATQGLSDRCKDRIEKAHRVVSNMVATIAFFFRVVELYMDSMELSDRERMLMQNYLIPGFYLQEVARREKDARRKALIQAKSQELLALTLDGDGTPADCDHPAPAKLRKAARECAMMFQRSSSCVEGRNAQLSLRHHGVHRLSNRHLSAQTVVHNYYIRREDGTTPAERFFGAKPTDVFRWLIKNMDYPPRPRVRMLKAS